MAEYLNSDDEPITASSKLFVTVKECQAVIDTSMSSINDVFYHRWGSTEPSIRIVTPFLYTAPCPLKFSYEAKILMQDGATLADLPDTEIMFQESSKQIFI